MVDGEFDHLTVNDKLTMKAQPGESPYIDIETVMYGQDPILEVSQAVKVKDDINAYGFLGTASDPAKGYGGGAIQMGHAWERTDDPPRINLTDDNYHTLYITAGSSLPNGIDAVLADMKLKKLTATGGAKLNAVAIGMDEYGDIPYEYESIQLNPAHNLRFCFGTNERMMLSNAGRLELPVQGSNGGLQIGDVSLYREPDSAYTLRLQNSLIVEQYLWCTELAVNADVGINGTLIVGEQTETSPNISIMHYNDHGWITSHKGALFLGASAPNPYDVRYVMPPADGLSEYPHSLGHDAWRWYQGYFYFVTAWDYFVADALDDLALVKNYKTKTVEMRDKQGNKIPRSIIDPDSLSFLNDGKGNWSLGATNGFLLGCVKQLVLRLEKLEEQLKSGN